MSLSLSSTRIARKACVVAAIAAVMVFSAVGTAGAKGPPQSIDSGTSAGTATGGLGTGPCFANLTEDGTFTRTFVIGNGNVTAVLRSPYDLALCVQQTETGGEFTDSGTFTLTTPEGTLMASVSGTETVATFSFTLTATGGTGLYQGVTGTIAWSGTRIGSPTFTTAGVWTANLNRPVL